MKSGNNHIKTLIAQDRRGFLKSLAALGMGVAVMPAISRRAVAADEVSIYTWSNYNDPKLFPEYVKKHGNPQASFFGDEIEALNKLRSGYVVDLAHPCNDAIMRFRNSNVIQPFDARRLKYVDDMWPELTNLPGTVDEQGQRWFLPFDWGNSSVIYRTDLVDLKEPSWSLIFTDDRYKGRVAMYDSGEPAMEIAALLLGYKNIYALDDDQLKECAKVLRHQRNNARLYWSDQTSAEQGMASGELVAMYGWNDAVQRLKKQGLPVAYMLPKEGMLTWVCGLVLHKSAPHEDLAYDFANAFTSPEAGAYLIGSMGTGHANKKAFDMVPKETLERLGISNPAETMKRTNFIQEIAEERRVKYNQIFDQVKAGG
ncbi:PotD/PotF family extracellular solute-binding protein [Dongia soli]|uniref:Extracellular solute-binding protein n=1 Tax=Dongia soli TaxID=600628 RepID=A0ABU5ECZ7_9PROT|nr:extracellular solute-binding protein [Dongia soli]MDY0883430.1 extracellular solute-binding protein [Dongia soli]